MAFDVDVGRVAVWGPTGDGRILMRPRASGMASVSRLTTAPSVSEQILPLAVQCTPEVVPDGSGLGTMGLMGSGLASRLFRVSAVGAAAAL